jgi:hypothetical protein
VRYAIVGLGDIAQEDMMPGVDHAGNAEITALVTSDQDKARGLGEKYGVDTIFSYEQFDAALGSGTFDAIYLATPNWRHAEFIVPALRAGIHVLTEKPLEVSTEKCRQILDAAKISSAKLMVGYRLHFEPATLDTIDKIRSGVLGEVHLFASTFAQLVDPDATGPARLWLAMLYGDEPCRKNHLAIRPRLRRARLEHQGQRLRKAHYRAGDFCRAPRWLACQWSGRHRRLRRPAAVRLRLPMAHRALRIPTHRIR